MAPEARVLPLWRAPAASSTPNAIALAGACGLRHQGWTANGFWGDELDSAKHPNAELASRAIERTRDGEVVVMHWGIRSRRDPFAGVLDEVIGGLQARGLCFATAAARGARMTALGDRYTDLTGWIFEHALQPLLYALGMMDWAEDAYAWLDFALFGLFGIAVAWAPLPAAGGVAAGRAHGRPPRGAHRHAVYVPQPARAAAAAGLRAAGLRPSLPGKAG